MYINQSHTGTSFLPVGEIGNLRLRIEQGLRLFLCHAEAVVFHGQKDHGSVFSLNHFTSDMDFPILIHARHTVIDGIFQDGLQNKLYGQTT